MYDIIIIGGGPGGYHMAALAAQKGKKVAVIEGHKLGGTCLNVGCIPSKAFIHYSNILAKANGAINKGALNGEAMTLNHEYVVESKDKNVEMLVKGTEMQVKKAGAEIINGWAKILPPKGEEFRVEVNDEILSCTDLVIATGSKVFVPNFINGAKENYKPGDTSSPILTSDEILSLKEVPKELVVIGAGVIGLELGTYFTYLGTKVTIIDIASKIAGPFDTEISNAFQKRWEKKGVNFILESKVTEVSAGKVKYEDQEGNEHEITCDKILMSVGRKPNSETLGLENIPGLEVENGYVKTDIKLRTSVPHVYAIGDVNGVSQLAHTAYREGEVALSTILGNGEKMNYAAIPAVIYGKPEISEIGFNEDAAKEKGLNYRVMKLSMLYSGRAVVENSVSSGEVVKLIINNNDDRIIGFSMFGAYASELVGMASVIIGMKFDINDIKKLVFAHPSVGELFKDIINH